jgi:hypothetical protein
MSHDKSVATDPTSGAKAPAEGKRPRDNPESLPEGPHETPEQAAGRDTERALEEALTKLPPG